MLDSLYSIEENLELLEAPEVVPPAVFNLEPLLTTLGGAYGLLIGLLLLPALFNGVFLFLEALLGVIEACALPDCSKAAAASSLSIFAFLLLAVMVSLST